MKSTMKHLLLALGLSMGSLLVVLTLLSLPTLAADQCAAPGGAGACFATIQAAVDNAGPGDTVRVVAGSYNQNLVINKNLTLLGGFNDTGLTNRTPRSSIIDGGGGVGVVISITNNAAVTIDGFTITNGNGTTNNGYGGGISVNGASATIRDNLIENNIASDNSATNGNGGGISILNSTGPLLIENNTIQNNLGSTATGGRGFGGGISSENVSVITITNNIIVGNTSLLSGSGAAAGGILLNLPSVSGQKLTITNNWVMNNSAAITVSGSVVFAVGGGIGVFGDGANNETLTLQNNHLIGNIAVHQMTASTNGFADGGGASIQGVDNALLTGNEFVSNVTAYTVTISGGANGNGGGGGLSLLRTTALVQDNVINGNVAHQAGDGGVSGTLGESYGAGISVQDGVVTIDRNLIISNRRNAAYADGGNSGLWAWQSTVTSTNNIFAHNFDGLGAGNNTTMKVINDTYYDNGKLGVSSFMGSTVLVNNTIVVSHNQGLAENGGGTTLTGNFNLISNTTNYGGGAAGGANDIINQDPLFQNAANDNFHLTSTSPAIDAGTSTGAPSVDFDNDSRPQDAGIDIGADEFTIQDVYLPVVLK